MIQFLRYRGDAARDRKDWKTAAHYYNLYTRLVPSDADIAIQLGHAWKEQGHFERARRCYNRALRRKPEDADLLLQLGHLQKVSGNLRAAIGWYMRSLKANPDFEPAKQELSVYSDILGLTKPSKFRPYTVENAQSTRDHEQDHLENLREAAFDATEVQASREVLEAFRRGLPKPEHYGEVGRTPQILHFVYGFENGQEGDIPYYGYLAIRSALHFNPNWTAYLYCPVTPTGPNWDRISSDVTVVNVGYFEYLGAARLFHQAHKAEVVRLMVVNYVGGACLSLDTITRRSFEGLRDAEFCMGVQAAGWTTPPGLCNSVMVGQSGARFSTNWLRAYESFRSIGRDDLWNYHSFRIPVTLMQQDPQAIRILDYRAFAYPLWYTAEAVLFSDSGQKYKEALTEAYCFTLWCEATMSTLAALNDQFIEESGSLYAGLARQVKKAAQ